MNDLYIGQTNNISIRNIQQTLKTSKAAKFIKDSGGKFTLVYYEIYTTRKEALNREKQLKRWTRAKKEALINRDFDLLKKL